jgi:hypothetical protein
MMVIIIFYRKVASLAIIAGYRDSPMVYEADTVKSRKRYERFDDPVEQAKLRSIS